MSIKIHHGPPGSFKTSGAVEDDLIPAIKAGRVIVTNVRGLDSLERFEAVLGDIPDTCQLIHLPTTDHEDASKNRQYWACWFHWVPHGAFILLDEAQDIWPKKWKEKDLRALDFPDGREAANAENRPFDFITAFDMHRHYGWDMVLTTPKITKIRDDIRGAAEGAFKHKNLGIIGIGGRYIEGFHLAEDSGSANSDFITVRPRKISPTTFKLYASTATGTFSDTKAGLSILANPRLVLLVLVLFGALFWTGTHPPRIGPPPAVPAASSAPPAPVLAVLPAPAPALAGPSASGAAVRLDAGPPAAPPAPLSGWRLRVVSEVSTSANRIVVFRAIREDEEVRFYEKDLIRLGYRVERVRWCMFRLEWRGASELVGCPRDTSADRRRGRDDVGGAPPALAVVRPD